MISADLLRAAREALQRCAVKPHEEVIVYGDSQQPHETMEAFATAATSLGVEEVSVVRTMRRFPETDPPPPAVEALRRADLIVDMATESWVYAPAAADILRSGARVLLTLDLSPDDMIARPPDTMVAARVERAGDLLADAEVFRITSPEGTEFTCRRGGRPFSLQRGFADSPGRFALYAAGAVNFAPLETSGDGVLYLNGAQILYPDHTYVVEEPVRVDVEKGRIVAVDTGHQDGRIFAQWLRQFDDATRVVSHVGFGADHRVRSFPPFDISSWESRYGAVIVAFGANDSVGLAGENRAEGHSDSIVTKASLHADGVAVIEQEEFTEVSGLRATQGGDA